MALAQRVQELSRYRSDFFGRLREILGGPLRHRGGRRPLRAAGLGALRLGQRRDQRHRSASELDKLADAILELERQIPPEINWVIRVDGHTDMRPLQAATPLPLQLGAVGRARHRGGALPDRPRHQPEHLVAAGFGEFQPLDAGDSEEAYARNRRIELKLTER